MLCYSDYLSDRDFESFQNMFMKFGLTNLIRYGSSSKVCEKFLNERGNIRDGVSSIISSTKGINLFAVASKNEERILLIDEVDVFFNKDFYANIYKPYAKLCSDEITALVKEIWEECKRGVKNVLSVAEIKKWPLYIACINKYIGWEFLGRLEVFSRTPR